ncbi:MAG: AAA family ATPase [Bacteroidales bacterium]|nr:AAA family ATPase [Bacteroidales bacterium]
MNIKSFSIEGLFNRFNHRIEFKNNITIIIGKNGVGKTTCLELLNSLFSGDFSKLREVPYHKRIW